ncbi:hypothetical protein [Acetobacter phage phiAX1]|nr:hypothetical protein [Acetobacter phage phiAX1]
MFSLSLALGFIPVLLAIWLFCRSSKHLRTFRYESQGMLEGTLAGVSLAIGGSIIAMALIFML